MQVVAALLVCALTATELRAAAPSIEAVQVGFQGYYKVGLWAPLRVEFQGGEGTLDLMVETIDPEGNRQVLPVPELSFPRSEPLELIVQSGRLGSAITLRLREPGENGKVVATRIVRPVTVADPEAPATVMLKQNVSLLACWGDPKGFTDLAAQQNLSETTPDQASLSRELRVISLNSAADFPKTLRGYDALTALIITENYDLSNEVSQAVREWVEAGGTLVVTVGQQVKEWQQSPLAEWVPVTVDGSSSLRELSGLESFSGRNERIAVPGRVTTARILPGEGQLLASGLDGPLLVRRAFGFGQVIFCGIDLHTPPMSNWKALPVFVRNLLFPEENQSSATPQKRSTQLSHSGMTDLSTQLYSAQDDFPSVKRFSNWSVMGLMLLYLLLIGPLDYLLVHRVLKKPQLTWITFPVLVAISGGLAIWQARASNGDQFLVNQLEVIDIDATRNTARVQSLATIYSPKSERYEIDFLPRTTGLLGTEAPAPLVNWFGTPEDTFGGMYRPGGVELTQTRYQLSPQYHGVQNLPISVWSTRSLEASWSQSVENLVESDLKTVGVEQLSGTIIHHLPVPIENWMLAYRRRVYRPRSSLSDPSSGALRPGIAWEPFGPGVYQRELKGYLTGMQARRERSQQPGGTSEIVVEQSAYDVYNRNPEDVLRMITFHEAAGGTSYTALTNTLFDDLDLSPLLMLDRAVLLGQITLPAAELEINGTVVKPTRRTCFVRLVIPVERSDELLRELPKLTD